MPLLMAFRRYWAIVFVAVLLLPTIGLFTPDLPAPLRTVLEPKEEWWDRASERLDPYINNVFGFRGAVLAAHATYGRWIGAGTDRVLKGEGGALFIKDEQAVEQSLGQLVRPDMVKQVVDVAAALDAYMRAKGGRFAMVVPPNGATTNFELLPAYAQRLKTSPTEYDLIAAALKKRDITFVDLRPILKAGKAGGPVHFLHDTHWNERGALLSFNATMAALGRPDLEVDPKAALGPAGPRDKGDLLRLMGETAPGKPDREYPFKGPFHRPEPEELTPLPGIVPPLGPKDDHSFQPMAYEGMKPSGPRIMVIGDSFTHWSWAGLLRSETSAFAWMHHRYCRFDMEIVRRFNPDILIFAPTERQAFCKGPITGL